MKHIIITSALFFLISCYSKVREKEKYVLPEGYRGEVIIIFDQTEGASKTYDEERFRIYSVPRNGILLTQFPANRGWSDLTDSKVVFDSENSENATYCATQNISNVDSTTLVHTFHKNGSRNSGAILYQYFVVDYIYNLSIYGDFPSSKLDSLLNTFR